MSKKWYKEIIFAWIDGSGEYQYERRIVRNKEKGDDLND